MLHSSYTIVYCRIIINLNSNVFIESKLKWIASQVLYEMDIPDYKGPIKKTFF